MLYMEGPKPGVITLTIARRVSGPGSRGSSSSLLTSSSGTYFVGIARAHHFRSNLTNLQSEWLCDSEISKFRFSFADFMVTWYFSGPELCRTDSDGVTPDHSIGSEASDSTVIFLPGHDTSFKSDRLNDSQLSSSSQRSQDYSSRNPVIDRLTGRHPGIVINGLRNESYYRVICTSFT